MNKKNFRKITRHEYHFARTLFLIAFVSLAFTIIVNVMFIFTESLPNDFWIYYIPSIVIFILSLVLKLLGK